MLGGVRRRIWIVVGAAGLVLVATVIGALLVGRIGQPAAAIAALDLPARGAVRADYLPDGTPVWVVRHENGNVDLLSAFSTHVPYGVMKLTVWCSTSRRVEDPFQGAEWNEYGQKIAGPAPLNLAGWLTRIEGNKVSVVGGQSEPVAAAVATAEIEGCTADHTIVHRFEGWRRWDSPREAMAAQPTGWILIAGSLVTRSDGSVLICAFTGCEDSAVLGGVGPLPSDRAAAEPWPDDLFIVRVRDGRLEGLTRIIPANRT